MRKLTAIIFSVFLILSMGQIVSANNKVSGVVSYEGSVTDGDVLKNGFKAGVDVQYYFTPRISLAGGMDFNFLFEQGTANLVTMDFNVFGGYDLFKMEKANIGLQLGFSGNAMLNDDKASVFYLGLGAYGDVDITSKINLYVNTKFPVLSMSKESGTGFFKAFLYNIKVGASYDVTSNIDIGLEFNIHNNDVLSMLCSSSKDPRIIAFMFNVGLKVGYKF